jgi:hypothetical protein
MIYISDDHSHILSGMNFQKYPRMCTWHLNLLNLNRNRAFS